MTIRPHGPPRSKQRRIGPGSSGHAHLPQARSRSWPARLGTIIQRLSRGDLGGKAQIDYRPDGVHVAIQFALSGATA
jgi:hypothetical protein